MAWQEQLPVRVFSPFPSEPPCLRASLYLRLMSPTYILCIAKPPSSLRQRLVWQLLTRSTIPYLCTAAPVPRLNCFYKDIPNVPDAPPAISNTRRTGVERNTAKERTLGGSCRRKKQLRTNIKPLGGNTNRHCLIPMIPKRQLPYHTSDVRTPRRPCNTLSTPTPSTLFS